MFVLGEIGLALQMAFFMFWEVFWPLVLGFGISAIVQTAVSKRTVAGFLGKDNLRGVTFATLFGAASSSCSYASVAVARGLFRKGSTFSNAILFEFASTNLVFELGLVLFVLLGWRFVGAEFAGGILMIGILAVIFKYTLRPWMVEEARRQAEKGLAGRHEGHGEMDMSVTDGPFLARLFSPRAFTAIAHNFYMDIDSLWPDLLIGFLIAGALSAWVPNSWWQAVFLSSKSQLAFAWGPFIGPIISMLSFVCSIGNVPLAVVLWNGGISFGGVIAFIFGDLIILPIVDIYRRYYGGRMSLYLLGVSYLSMVVAGLVIGGLFQLLGLTPAHHLVTAFQARPEWNYTTYLNVLFFLLAIALFWRFLKTGGPEMLRMMAISPDPKAAMATDPVCGMTVDPSTATENATVNGITYHFCSSECREAFEQNPERYLSRIGAVGGHPERHEKA